MEINIKEAKTVALANLKLLKVHPEARDWRTKALYGCLKTIW